MLNIQNLSNEYNPISCFLIDSEVDKIKNLSRKLQKTSTKKTENGLERLSIRITNWLELLDDALHDGH